jgi:hypothetical protein
MTSEPPLQPEPLSMPLHESRALKQEAEELVGQEAEPALGICVRQHRHINPLYTLKTVPNLDGSPKDAPGQPWRDLPSGATHGREAHIWKRFRMPRKNDRARSWPTGSRTSGGTDAIVLNCALV